MNVLDIAQTTVHVVHVDDSVATVHHFLNNHHLSCIPVIDSLGKCFGIISAKDLLHFHSESRNALIEKAWEICTHRVIEIDCDCEILAAARLMIEKDIHHLIVMEEKAIRGIVSSVDLLKALADGLHLDGQHQ